MPGRPCDKPTESTLIMQTLKTLGLATALTALAASGAFAQATNQPVTLSAAPANFPGDAYGDTAQVGANGPSSSMKYLDVEGAGNGTFATFGVVDFFSNGIADANGNTEFISSVMPSITLDFTDQTFSQTRPGNLNFYLADSTAPLSSLKYDSTDTSATAGVGSQLGNLFSLGRGVYASTSRTPAGGDLPYTLNLNSAAQSLFLQRLNANGDLRFVVTADPGTGGSTEVASFAGAGGGSGGNYPTLTFNATGAAAPVPEASTTVSLGLLLALGLGGVAVARRRKAQA